MRWITATRSVGLFLFGMMALWFSLVGLAQAADDSFDRVLDSGQLVVGIEGAYPPFNMFNSENELIGFDVDISKEIARRLGVDAEFVPTPWEGIVVGLQAGKYDAIISSLANTPERAERVLFTEQTYYRSGGQIVVRSGSDIQSGDDLVGKRVGVQVGTTYADALADLGIAATIYDTDFQSFPDLAFGRLDALVTDRFLAIEMIENENYDMDLVDELLFTENIGIAVQLGDEQLRRAIDDALSAMYDDGTYHEISMRWFGADIR